jgi:hypothetical protein
MATPKSIGQLLTDLDGQWQDAGYASSGAEGMAAMGTIRRTQAALVRAYLVAAEQATEPSVARDHLQKAHALLVEILGSQQADEHPGLVDVRAYVEGLLARQPTR